MVCLANTSQLIDVRAKNGLSRHEQLEGAGIGDPVELPARGSWTAQVFQDSKYADRDPRRLLIEKRTVKNSTRLNIRVVPGGGCAMILTPRR